MSEIHFRSAKIIISLNKKLQNIAKRFKISGKTYDIFPLQFLLLFCILIIII